ncbi:TPA: hypothetical protein HA225_00040 [Candidatus Micrarchaeota archaeon]|nr:hypothetical protein [Candidatus Micrarchaeota archaeon]HIH30878.1 hypothetical protein [Candidatus Micrarchaeota archaeon]
MAKVCIVCEKETVGRRVEDDMVIRTIRRIKQSVGAAKNNELVVCESCLEAHKKKREKFEKNLVMHVVVAAIVLIIFFFVSVFSASGISIMGIILGLILAALIVGFAVFSHWPKIEEEQKRPLQESAVRKKAPAGKKRKK